MIKRSWPDLHPRDVHWVLSPTHLRALFEELQAAADDAGNSWWVTYDLETTGLDENARSARIAMAGVTLGRLERPQEARSFIVGLSHPDGPFASRWRPVLRDLAGAIAETRLPLAGQNIRFDARWTYAHCGVDLADRISWDTGLSSHLLDENSSSSLKNRAQLVYDVTIWNEAADFSALEREQRQEAKALGVPVDTLPRLLSERVDFFDLGIYCARDTHWTWALVNAHREELGLGSTELDPETPEERVQLRVANFHRHVGVPMVRSITSMEQRGWTLDVPWTIYTLEQREKTASEALISLEEMLPGTPEDYDVLFPPPRSYEPTSLWFAHWANLMIQQQQLRIIATTATNKPSWSKAVLKRLAAQGSTAARVLLEYRVAAKQAQFLRSWLTLVSRHGTVHSTYSYYRVVTGRTSSSDPNMQQVTHELRPAFVARQGFVLLDADYSQIEMRCAAHTARSEPMIEAFRRGDDLHRIMAAQVARKAEADVTPEERQRAKAVNFGFLFGMGPRGFMNYALDSYDVEFTEEEATEAYQAYFRTWNGLAQWHAATAQFVDREAYVISPLGRVRRFPRIHSADDYEHSGMVRQAINSPIQSMASDILQIAVNKIRRELSHRDVHVLGMVHDSVILEVPEEYCNELAVAVRDRMVNLRPELLQLGCRLEVPLAVDMKMGPRWGSGEKVSFA